MRSFLATAFGRAPHLPTLLLATMLAIGLAVEATLDGGVEWAPKWLLIACLAVFAGRRWSRFSKR